MVSIGEYNEVCGMAEKNGMEAIRRGLIISDIRRKLLNGDKAEDIVKWIDIEMGPIV